LIDVPRRSSLEVAMGGLDVELSQLCYGRSLTATQLQEMEYEISFAFITEAF
jgi:hypothetical protein